MRKVKLEIKTIKRNLRRVHAAAENGNPESMLKLGKHYSYLAYRGDCYHDDDSFILSIYWLSKAAQNGKWEACYWLGASIEIVRERNSHFGYLCEYIRGQEQENVVWKDIIAKLHAEGFNKNNVSVCYGDDVYKNNLAAIWLWDISHFGYSLENVDTLECQYYRVAAEHGIIAAETRYGFFCKRAWGSWYHWLEGKSPEEMLNILAENDMSVDSVCHFYETAKYWLVEALRDGDDYALSDLNGLMGTQYMQDKLREAVPKKQ